MKDDKNSMGVGEVDLQSWCVLVDEWSSAISLTRAVRNKAPLDFELFKAAGLELARFKAVLLEELVGIQTICLSGMARLRSAEIHSEIDPPEAARIECVYRCECVTQAQIRIRELRGQLGLGSHPELGGWE